MGAHGQTIACTAASTVSKATKILPTCSSALRDGSLRPPAGHAGRDGSLRPLAGHAGPREAPPVSPCCDLPSQATTTCSLPAPATATAGRQACDHRAPGGDRALTGGHCERDPAATRPRATTPPHRRASESVKSRARGRGGAGGVPGQVRPRNEDGGHLAEERALLHGLLLVKTTVNVRSERGQSAVRVRKTHSQRPSSFCTGLRIAWI